MVAWVFLVLWRETFGPAKRANRRESFRKPMKKIILSILIAALAAGVVVPSAKADVVVVVGPHHRHRHPKMIWVPAHREGPWYHRRWVAAHWAPA